MSKKGLTLKIFCLILCDNFANSTAQLLMKKGLHYPVADFFNFHAIFNFILGNIASPMLWLGISIYAFSFFIWIVILSNVDLSVAMPMASTDYLLVPLLAIIFLHETVSPLRWIGIVTIVLGIYFVSKSGKQPLDARNLS
jgi:drug/metabolite transporter (DMT)-like permease